MPRAANGVADHKTIGERPMIMRAMGRDGEDFRASADKQHLLAETLARAMVMFLRNCRAPLRVAKRGNSEPDFLVCHKGTRGILEVVGEPFHPPTRTVHDHERDRPLPGSDRAFPFS